MANHSNCISFISSRAERASFHPQAKQICHLESVGSVNSKLKHRLMDYNARRITIEAAHLHLLSTLQTRSQVLISESEVCRRYTVEWKISFCLFSLIRVHGITERFVFPGLKGDCIHERDVVGFLTRCCGSVSSMYHGTGMVGGSKVCGWKERQGNVLV